MLNIRYTVRLSKAFIFRFKFLIFISLVAGLFIFIGLQFFIPLFFHQNMQIIGIVGRFQPDTMPNSILDQISSGLTTLDKTGEPSPALAASWESKENGKVWIFHLKDNQKWQDGSPILSSNLNYSFDDVTISTPDDKTIIFTLNEAFSPFPVVLSKPAFKKGLLGTGDWVAKKITLNGGYTESLTLQNSQKQRKIYKFYPTEERAKTAFMLGDVDSLEQIISASPLNNWNTTNIEKVIDLQKITTIFFNYQDETVGKDNKNLRQALYYAIDKESFGGQRAISPISPLSWAYNPQVKKYSYDPKRAKELLETYPKSFLENLNIKLTTTPSLLDVAEKVAKYWEGVGVKTTVQVVTVLPQQYQSFLAIYDAPKDPDQYLTWHSSQIGSTNISQLENPRINKLLEDGRLELNPNERKKIYLDFQRFLLEDVPAIFLYHPATYNITRK